MPTYRPKIRLLFESDGWWLSAAKSALMNELANRNSHNSCLPWQQHYKQLLLLTQWMIIIINVMTVIITNSLNYWNLMNKRTLYTTSTFIMGPTYWQNSWQFPATHIITIHYSLQELRIKHVATVILHQATSLWSMDHSTAFTRWHQSGPHPHLTQDSLGTCESATQMASQSIQLFMHSTPVCWTHTQTMIHCNICSNRLQCLGCDTKNKHATNSDNSTITALWVTSPVAVNQAAAKAASIAH